MINVSYKWAQRLYAGKYLQFENEKFKQTGKLETFQVIIYHKVSFFKALGRKFQPV